MIIYHTSMVIIIIFISSLQRFTFNKHDISIQQIYIQNIMITHTHTHTHTPIHFEKMSQSQVSTNIIIYVHAPFMQMSMTTVRL